jgi:hypothetical protein
MKDAEDPLSEPLSCAVYAAEAAAQATLGLWRLMSPTQQSRWVQEAQTCWPRRDVFLKVILPAAERILSDEHEASS